MPLIDWKAEYAEMPTRELEGAYADLANAIDDAGIEAGESDHAKLYAMRDELDRRERAAFLADRQRGDDDGMEYTGHPAAALDVLIQRLREAAISARTRKLDGHLFDTAADTLAAQAAQMAELQQQLAFVEAFADPPDMTSGQTTRDELRVRAEHAEKYLRDVSVALSDAGCLALTVQGAVAEVIQRAERADAQLAEVTAERDAFERGAQAVYREAQQDAAERDAQVREAFNRGFFRGDIQAYTSASEAWEAEQLDQKHRAFLARAGAVGSVGAEPKET